MTREKALAAQEFMEFADGSKSPWCRNCNLVLGYTLIRHVCPNRHGKLHKCMRCGLIFECPTPDACTAQYQVVPNMIVDGKIVEHCPPHPSWDWIRDLVAARSEQSSFTEGLPTGAYGRCTLRDSEPEWRCHKREGHNGSCSTHNDCGAVSEDYRVCGFPPYHAGRHAWERK